MVEALNIELFYAQKMKYLSQGKVRESSTTLLEFIPKDKEYYYKRFIDDFKKALKAFNNNSLCDIEIYFNTDYEKRVLMVNQTWQDKEAGVYTLYDYTDKTSYNANITKVSKEVVIKRFISEVDRILQENNI